MTPLDLKAEFLKVKATRQRQIRRFRAKILIPLISVVLIVALIFALNERSAYFDIAPHVEDAGGYHRLHKPDSFLQSLLARISDRKDGTYYHLVRFTPGSVSDTWLKENRIRLEAAVELELHINNPDVTDDGVKELADVQGLVMLDLADCDITDDGLASLAGLRRLNSLNLRRTGMTDASIATILAMPVTGVNLAETQVTDQGIAQLFPSKISGISLDSRQLTPVSFAALQRAARLYSVALYDADDASIITISQLKLSPGAAITISGSRVTSASVPVLERLIRAGSVRHIALYDVPFSKEELQGLKQVDVACRIYATSRESHE